MPTLGHYLSIVFAKEYGLESPDFRQYGENQFKQDPELSKKRTNVVLVYRGAFNPPHRGHLAFLWHTYTQLAKDLNIIAAIVYPRSDVSVREKCDYYPPGERHFIPLRDRRRLWMKDANFPPWACVLDLAEFSSSGLESRINKLARRDNCRVRFATLYGPDCAESHSQGSSCEMGIISDIAREAPFDHRDGLKIFKGFGSWFIDNSVMNPSGPLAETKRQMLERWYDLQRQKSIAAGEERARKAVTESYNSCLDSSANLFHGASDLATAKVDGLLGLDEETDHLPIVPLRIDPKCLATHFAALGCPKASSICWGFRDGKMRTLRFLRASPGQYAPFRGISSTEIQKSIRELKGYKLLSAIESMALSPNLLWDMLLPWVLKRDGSTYQVNIGVPLQLRTEQDLMVMPKWHKCALEEDEGNIQLRIEMLSSLKKDAASPPLDPRLLGKRKRSSTESLPVQLKRAQSLMQQLRKVGTC